MGAQTLAACPDLENLERLDLSYNAMTEQGTEALEATGVKVVANHQWEDNGGEFENDEYLFAGDIE